MYVEAHVYMYGLLRLHPLLLLQPHEGRPEIVAGASHDAPAPRVPAGEGDVCRLGDGVVHVARQVATGETARSGGGRGLLHSCLTWLTELTV